MVCNKVSELQDRIVLGSSEAWSVIKYLNCKIGYYLGVVKHGL